MRLLREEDLHKATVDDKQQILIMLSRFLPLFVLGFILLARYLVLVVHYGHAGLGARPSQMPRVTSMPHHRADSDQGRTSMHQRSMLSGGTTPASSTKGGLERSFGSIFGSTEFTAEVLDRTSEILTPAAETGYASAASGRGSASVATDSRPLTVPTPKASE